MKIISLAALIILSNLNTKLYLEEDYLILGVSITIQLIISYLIIKSKD